MNAIPDHPMRIGAGEIAEVISREGDHLLVQAGARRLPARHAASCLIEPAPGDTVLVAGDIARCYVIAVLDRATDVPTRIAVCGDLEIVAAAGRLRLAAGDAVELATPGEMTLSAGTATMRAERGRFLLDDLVVIGRTALAQLSRMRAIGQAFEMVVDRILTRAKRSVRFVSESEHVRAGEIDLRASGTLHANGQTTIVTAASLVKVDGGQIHLG